MRFANRVSLTYDVAAFLDVIPAVPAIHNHLIVVPPPVFVLPKPMGLSVEQAVLMMWPFGVITGAHKFTSSVYHNGTWFALEGHDVGPMILHISVEPSFDLLMPVHFLRASRKAKFKAGEVKANQKAVACCTMLVDVPAVTPMATCGDIEVPNTGTGSSVFSSSLLVGMHWIDLVMGWVDVIVSAIQSIVTSSASFGLSSVAPDTIGLKPIPSFGSLAAALVGFAGQEFFGYRGDVAFSYKPVRGPLGEVGITMTQDGSTGTRHVTGNLRAGPEWFNLGGQVRASDHRFDDENPSETWDVDAQGRFTGPFGMRYGGRYQDSFGEPRSDSERGSSVVSESPSFDLPVDSVASWEDLPAL